MRTFRPARAFTLIEAIAAIVLVSVALPAMTWAIRDAEYRRADPVLLARARWLAAERLEDILADRSSPTRGYSYVLAANYPAETQVQGFLGFSRSVSVSETGVSLSGTGSGFKTATVTVGWRDGRGRARSLALSTVVARYTAPGYLP